MSKKKYVIIGSSAGALGCINGIRKYDKHGLITVISKEDKLLLFAQKNNFKILILYKLNKVNKRITLSDPRNNNILSEFIQKAKQKYQIKKIGASGESADFFCKNHQCLQQFTPKID